MKCAMIFVLMGILLTAGCAKPNGPIACTMDAKICPDGSAVGREGPNCEFAPCPGNECDYSSEEKKYVGKSADECSRIKFACTMDRAYFEDECGCGCALIERGQEGKLQATDCTIPRPEICTMQYAPVCGWFDPSKIQCIKHPCANTFSNSCHACSDDKVISWTGGECPE